jgi:hypothetical protein
MKKQYEGIDVEKTKNSLCLELFHGRESPDRQLHDWGLQGPILGPFQVIHVTYNATIRILFENDDEFMLNFVDDLVYYDGVFYGDWMTCAKSDIRGCRDKTLKIQKMREELFQCPDLVKMRCRRCLYSERNVVGRPSYPCPVCNKAPMLAVPVRLNKKHHPNVNIYGS